MPRYADEALPIAQAEARRRGLGDIVPLKLSVSEPAYLGDWVELQIGLTPQEAKVFAAMLQAAGIDASAGDTNLVQAHSLLAIAVGGCRLRVPAAQIQEANDLLDAFRRGDLALGDDFDPQP